jgi:histidine triad (HIT) family protein
VQLPETPIISNDSPCNPACLHGHTDEAPCEHAVPPCPFCDIVAGRAPATVVGEWPEAIAIEPLNPVTRGHILVIPREHVRDFTDYPKVSASTMLCAAEFAAGLGSYNLITSKGRPATQSVFHLHLHLVPRAENDGLALPWYSGRTRTPAPDAGLEAPHA